ncbi:MAG: hypothetical protein ABI132_07320 [Rhodanobacteraceae bacterium]
MSDVPHPIERESNKTKGPEWKGFPGFLIVLHAIALVVAPLAAFAVIGETENGAAAFIVLVGGLWSALALYFMAALIAGLRAIRIALDR